MIKNELHLSTDWNRIDKLVADLQAIIMQKSAYDTLHEMQEHTRLYNGEYILCQRAYDVETHLAEMFNKIIIDYVNEEES